MERRLQPDNIGLPVWVASLCVLVAAYLRLDLSFNAGHMDEYNYLFVGRWLLAGWDWPSHTYIFGADTTWALFALGNRFLEIIGARIIAFGIGVATLFIFYRFVQTLFNDTRVAIVATLLLSLQATHIFISRLATYDVLCAALFTFALYQGAKALQSEKNWVWCLFLGSLLYAMAILTKYVVLMYFPLFAMLLLLVNWKKALLFTLTLTITLSLYGVIHLSELKILFEVQLVGVHGENSRLDSLFLFAIYFLIYPLLLIFILEFIRNRNDGYKTNRSFVIGILTVLALPMPAYHLWTLNIISFHKHLVFSLIFLLPVVAHGLVRSSYRRLTPRLRSVLASVIVLGFLLINVYQLNALEQSYPDETRVSQVFDKQKIEDKSFLSENPYFFRYRYGTPATISQINDSGWLDNDGDGKYSHQDVVDALWDRKFDWVYLNDQIHPQHNDLYRSILSQRGYSMDISVDYSLNKLLVRNHTGSQTVHRKINRWQPGKVIEAHSGVDH